MSPRPLAVSMGDPAGVGLEIAVKAWAQRAALALPAFCLVGDVAAVGRAMARSGVEGRIAEASLTDAAQAFADALPVRPSRPLDLPEALGQAQPCNAAAIVDAIATAVSEVRDGAAAGIVTLPVAKAPLYEAGFRHPGQTEFVAELTADMPWPHARGPVMMLAGDTLKVALVTIHVPLAAVSGALNAARLKHVARVTAEALHRDFGVAHPRLALAGLNPHAGEGGALGAEERDLINPAAADLRGEGLAITDAQAPDTLFHAEARGRYDAVLALYHDQGLIPLKTLHFWDAVNVTLGLPVVRTSPDHGVAYDIAGAGKARADSFIAALRLAASMAARREA